MNLKEFVSNRSVCPLCSSKLSLYFHSKRKQFKFIDGEKYIFQLNIASFLYKKDFKGDKVSFIINSNSNDIELSFLSKDNIIFNKPYSDKLISRFNHFNKILYKYRFYLSCDACLSYSCSSNAFDIINDNIGQLSIDNECIGLYSNNSIHRVHNYYLSNKSTVYSYTAINSSPRIDSRLPTNVKEFNLKLLPIDVDLIKNKINQLLLFC